MTEYLFSYGTLQKEQVQLQLFGRILETSPDELRGYKIAVVEITDEAFLSKGEEKNQRTLVVSENVNDHVNGSVLELTQEDLLRADNYEPNNYRRKKAMLGSGREAWIFLAVSTP